MSWSSALRPVVLAGLVLSAGAALGACSFAPVYRSATPLSQSELNLAYAEPTTRLEQIIYQDLALRLGSSDAATAPLVSVATTTSAARVGLSATGNPNTLNRLTLTATLTVTQRDGSDAAPIRFTRQASAEYSTSGQVLADTAAANDAAARAARAAAESLRLTLLAALSR